MTLVDRLPRGCLRAAFRTPLWLYHHDLGWLLGHRLLYLAHRGRRSGLPRATVLEVVRLDHVAGEVWVVSAWGERSDWYRNLQAAPADRWHRFAFVRSPKTALTLLGPDTAPRGAHP